MARLFDDASSHYLEATSWGTVAAPVTLACWFYSDDLAVQETLVGIGRTGASGESFELRAGAAAAGNNVEARAKSGAVAASAKSTTAFSLNTWSHACAVFASSTDRRAFLEGGGKGTNTGSKTPASLDVLNVGCVNEGGARSNFMSGRIAEVAVWSAAVSDAEVAALARGVCPLRVLPGSLVGYWPLLGLDSPEPDRTVNAKALTVTGATKGNHAPVIPVIARLWRPGGPEAPSSARHRLLTLGAR